MVEELFESMEEENVEWADPEGDGKPNPHVIEVDGKFSPSEGYQWANPNLSDDERWEAQVKLQKVPRNASPSRGRNRCRQTSQRSDRNRAADLAQGIHAI